MMEFFHRGVTVIKGDQSGYKPSVLEIWKSSVLGFICFARLTTFL